MAKVMLVVGYLLAGYGVVVHIVRQVMEWFGDVPFSVEMQASLAHTIAVGAVLIAVNRSAKNS